MRGVAAGLLFLLLAAPAGARGAPEAYTTVSIEWMIATSAKIVRVTVTAVDADKHSFTYHVDEVLRGQAADDGVHLLGQDQPLPVFVRPGQSVLLFISPYDRPGDYYYPPFDLSSPFNPPFWTNFGDPLLDGATLLSALRDAIAKTPPGRLRSASLRPLNDTMRRVLEPRRESFTIPIDSRVEPLAYQLISSPREAMEWQGMYLLSQLPSPKNAQRLRLYLNDPRLRLLDQRLSPWTEKTYTYRKWASDLLATMGHPQTGIRLGEPANVYQPAWWGIVAAAILVVLAWLTLGRMKMLRPRGRRMVAMVWVTTTLLAILWVRSKIRLDDFCYADGRRLYALSVYDGGVRFQILHNFSYKTPLSHHAYRAISNPDDPRPWHEMDPAPRTVGYRYQQVLSPINDDPVTRTTNITNLRLWYFVLPLLPLALIPTLVMTYRSAVVRNRLRNGLCPSCGYDLRASPQRCPECGYVVGAEQHGAT